MIIIVDDMPHSFFSTVLNFWYIDIDIVNKIHRFFAILLTFNIIESSSQISDRQAHMNAGEYDGVGADVDRGQGHAPAPAQSIFASVPIPAEDSRGAAVLGASVTYLVLPIISDSAPGFPKVGVCDMS